MPGKPYRAYAVVRCETTGRQGYAFTYGLYDFANGKKLGGGGVHTARITDAEYHVYEIGTFPMHSSMYLWVAPTRNPDNVKAIWVDRFFLIGPLKAGSPKR